MKNLHIFLITLMVAFGMASAGVAGHHYHGCHMFMTDMDKMDSDDDGSVTFDEFSAPSIDKLESIFGMLDLNGDGKITRAEYDTFVEAHVKSYGSKSKDMIQ